MAEEISHRWLIWEARDYLSLQNRKPRKGIEDMKHRVTSILLKPASGDCNLKCEYCFYHPPYDSGLHRMEDNTLSKVISQYLGRGEETASFCWQGGEPMLTGIDFFKRVIELQIKHGIPGQRIGNAIQTNGILLNEEWATLFNEYNFLVGVSLDGPQELHEHYRGKGTFQKVMRALDILRENRVEFNILTVVNDINAGRVEELWDFFLSHNFYYLQFIPCVEKDEDKGKITPFSVKPEQYEEFLCRLFDRWYNSWYNKGEPCFSIRLFDNILRVYLGLEAEICEFKKECGEYVVIEYNGDVYPCDFFVREEWRLGNIHENTLSEIIASEPHKRFKALKHNHHKECERCRWEFICNHGCPRYRFGDGGESYLCRAYQNFFQYSAEKFNSLAMNLSKSLR